MSRLIIISISGNLYGSEMVLYDYLEATSKKHIVYIPNKSAFYNLSVKKISSKHIIKSYSSLYLLYAELFLRTLINKNNIYINEAGHIKWLSIISKLIPKRKYTTHVRIIEDTSISRINTKNTRNINIISTSQFIADNLVVKSNIIYDNYCFLNKLSQKVNILKNIGIIGRITKTKGFFLAKTFIEYHLRVEPFTMFHFFGDINDNDQEILNCVDYIKNKFGQNIIFHGFVAQKQDIYNRIDIVMHFNRNEALGRIFLEAIDYYKPFFSFNDGGIAEIGELCNISENLINFDNDWESLLSQKILKINLNNEVEKLIQAKEVAQKIFSTSNYIKQLEEIIL